LAGKDSLNLLRDAFMQADVNGFTFKTIRTALVTSATPYAQEVMAGYIIAQKSNWNALKKIIPSCGVVANPTYPLQQMLEVIAFDKQAADNNRAAAQLALGNIAGTVRKTAIARADSIAVRLAALLANQGDDLLYLSALGNCGTSSSLRFIIPYLSDTNMAIKGMAFYALRFIEEPAVDSIFVRALQQEQDADLLINIFNALYFRSSQQGMIEALEHIIQQHAPDKVRLSALQVLFEYSYREPVLLTVIGRIANGNASAATRDAANEFLRKIQ
jgi:hemoglobin-like flavoprotein